MIWPSAVWYPPHSTCTCEKPPLRKVFMHDHSIRSWLTPWARLYLELRWVSALSSQRSSPDLLRDDTFVLHLWPKKHAATDISQPGCGGRVHVSGRSRSAADDTFSTSDLAGLILFLHVSLCPFGKPTSSLGKANQGWKRDGGGDGGAGCWWRGLDRWRDAERPSSVGAVWPEEKGRGEMGGRDGETQMKWRERKADCRFFLLRQGRSRRAHIHRKKPPKNPHAVVLFILCSSAVALEVKEKRPNQQARANVTLEKLSFDCVMGWKMLAAAKKTQNKTKTEAHKENKVPSFLCCFIKGQRWGLIGLHRLHTFKHARQGGGQID